MFGIPDLETFDQVFTDHLLPDMKASIRWIPSEWRCPWNAGFDIDEIPGEEIIKILRDAVKSSKLYPFFFKSSSSYLYNFDVRHLKSILKLRDDDPHFSIQRYKNEVLKLKNYKNLF